MSKRTTTTTDSHAEAKSKTRPKEARTKHVELPHQWTPTKVAAFNRLRPPGSSLAPPPRTKVGIDNETRPPGTLPKDLRPQEQAPDGEETLDYEDLARQRFETTAVAGDGGWDELSPKKQTELTRTAKADAEFLRAVIAPLWR